ncbi:TonB-dependent receptor [Veronia nyctiphanis]|uniref:TonB-dependent receptor n=1 Tax=Veronia nyctiphanis TaxID=1278244 RepID=A0A4Q0YZ84_9GAMM|nr:TonB-dependent hemoglobin/transferrin/lactoferrin family receptor [Veronia nyctiphanis]RXJ74529.1 TonB-dependent receptor [Veronia nyctiphanis]
MNVYYKTPLALMIGLAFTSSLHAEDIYTFDEVIVSATQSEQQEKNVAASVSRVGREQLDDDLAQNLNQVFKSLPGVAAKGQGRFGVSGFNIRGRDENYVKNLIDGVELPNSYNPGADVMRKYSTAIEPDSLKAVEVSKGPVSSVHGSNALAGAVVFSTLDPADILESEEGNDTSAKVKAGYYSADQSYKVTTSIANRTGDVESLLQITHRSGHETETHSNGADIEGTDRGLADPSEFDANNVLAKFIVPVNENHTVSFTGEAYDRQAETELLSREGKSLGPGFTYSDNQGEDQDSRYRATINHEWTTDNVLFDQLNWSLSYMLNETEHKTFDTSIARGERMRRRQGSDSDYQFKARLQKDIELAGSVHEISYGVNFLKRDFELDYDTTKFPSGTVTPDTPLLNDAKSHDISIFVEDNAFLFEDSLVVNAGLRYDRFKADPADAQYDVVKNSRVTGRLGAVYNWTDQVNSFASVSQGFKSPTIQDLYYTYARGEIILPNPELKAEESLSYETGVRGSWDSGKASLSVFYTDYKNFIQQVETGRAPDGRKISTKINLNKSKIYGAEFSTTLGLDQLISAPKGTFAKLSVAYAKGKEGSDNKGIDSVSPLTSVATLGYDNASNDIGGRALLTAVAAKEGKDWRDETNLKAPGFATLDLTMYYKPVEPLTIRAGVYNVLDKQYWYFQDVAGLKATSKGVDRYSQSGRNFGIEVEYTF